MVNRKQNLDPNRVPSLLASSTAMISAVGEHTPEFAEDQEGCGLGLAIAEWIVRVHGGTIGINPHPCS